MTTTTYRTNLRCAGCLEKIRPHLDGLPGLKRWSVDLQAADKPLTIEGDASPDVVHRAMAQAGYQILGEAPASPAEPPPSYYPLVLIVAYLLGVTMAFEASTSAFDALRAMRHFMAGFFLVFSFFKLLDLPAFAAAFSNYDVIASRCPAYGYVYPFLELALGVFYLVNWQLRFVNLATVVLMAIGTVGVVHTLMEKKKVRCACLGAALNLPVATVTLIEDAGMGLMALAMLIWH